MGQFRHGVVWAWAEVAMVWSGHGQGLMWVCQAVSYSCRGVYWPWVQLAIGCAGHGLHWP
jgi:hypothetical protein